MSREDRLPKWAQSELSRLRSKLSSLEDAACDKDASSVYWEYGYPTTKRNIPDAATVVFVCGRERVRVSIRGDRLKINTDARVFLTPNASNDLDIEVRR